MRDPRPCGARVERRLVESAPVPVIADRTGHVVPHDIKALVGTGDAGPRLRAAG